MNTRILKRWEITLSDNRNIEVTDASLFEAKREVNKRYPKLHIVGYKQISDLEKGEEVVTNHRFNFGIVLYSKNGNSLPLYKMNNGAFEEVNLDKSYMKNVNDTYLDLIKKTHTIVDNKIIVVDCVAKDVAGFDISEITSSLSASQDTQIEDILAEQEAEKAANKSAVLKL